MFQKGMVRANSMRLLIRGGVGIFVTLFVFNKACENHLLEPFILGFIPSFILYNVSSNLKGSKKPNASFAPVWESLCICTISIIVIFNQDVCGIILTLVGFIPLIQAIDEEIMV